MTISRTFLAALALSALAGLLPAHADDMAKMPGTMPGMTMPDDANAAASTKAYTDAMAAMHEAMMVPYTGNADVDFLKGMIPHHQGAIDMAKVELQYGRDEGVRKLAEEIIKAQETEIAWMKDWLAKNAN